MADNFPDIPSKLGNPTKKSLFERQREEAEAKKAREKAETAAVLEDFVKSFDDDGDSPKQDNTFDRGGGRGASSLSGSVPGPGKRHFTSTGLRSGPGSLGPSPSIPRSGPGSLGSNTSYGKKRLYEDFKGQRRDRDSGHGIFSYEDERGGGFRAENEDRKDSTENKAAQPTLHLSSLPPGTSPAVIKALFAPSPLAIENVKMLSPPQGGPNSDRRSTSAIVTLASETPATDIDTMVSHLQNKYLGFGFNLSISRHLSSAALSGTTAIMTPSTSLPFNARPIPQASYSLSRAPPPGQSQGRFAPPVSYISSTPYSARSNAPATQVVVAPPNDLAQLKLIHKTLEALLLHGAEFEALLMSMPHIQRSEKWSWLFNARSAGGIYYRWRLWDTITDSSSRRQRQQPGDHLFEGQSVWMPPEQSLKFEYTTEMEEFVSDPDYDSSDEEDDDGGIAHRYNDHTHAGGGPPPEGTQDGDGTGYLNPLAKTKLVHLLARLPKSNARLRRGDVARVTGFAIEHAGSGADEVAEMIIANVVRPFSTTNARGRADSQDDSDEDKSGDRVSDNTPASLVGLYVISDILSSSASAGVRHAWRYRALFEAALRGQGTFERLGRIDKDLGWGKLKAEKWKRSVQSILTLWEGWCAFPQTSHDDFVKNFLEPPLSQVEKAKVEAEMKKAEEELQSSKNFGSKWKTLEERTSQDVLMDDIDGRQMEDDDVDGQPMDEGEDLIDENIDGVSMADSSDEEIALNNDEVESKPLPEARPPQVASIGLLNPRQRPRAVDMFADEDSGGE
jgi:U2-associated protein SR140